jgi:1-phosphatidylinositol-4-phosphate 5-kinase
VIKKIEHFWKGLSSDRSQISALPPQEYGERFIKFMAGVTMSPEEAEQDARDRAAAAEAEAAAATADDDERHGTRSAPAAPSYLPPPPPGMRSPNSPDNNPTVEKALKKATKNEKSVALEEELPERVLKTTNSSTASIAGKGNSHAVLPVVEETAEAGSVSGRSQGDNASLHRPFTPNNRMEHPGMMRSDGFTDLGPHGIGGRGPPTPPKSSYLDPEFRFGSLRRSGSGSSADLKKIISRDSLDKDLPPLPRVN